VTGIHTQPVLAEKTKGKQAKNRERDKMPAAVVPHQCMVLLTDYGQLVQTATGPKNEEWRFLVHDDRNFSVSSCTH